MANVLITNSCPRRCDFCFARSRVNQSRRRAGATHMSRENLRKVMTFLQNSGERELRLLGGEPTQHPEFREIVEEALDKGFHVHLFSNGMMPAKTADFLGGLPSSAVSLLVNVSPQAKDTPRQKEKVFYALEKLGPKAQVGITLTSPEFDYEYLLEYIDRFKLRRRIRIGVAQPIVGEQNSFLKPSEYRETGKAIVAMAKECAKREVLVGFDCGLTLCMFSAEEIGTLAFCSEGFKSLCAPIIDIGPDLDVWSCFPLAEALNSKLSLFPTRKHLVNFYREALAAYRNLGCMAQCARCKYRRGGQCSGGCLAHAMIGLDRLPPAQAPLNRPKRSGA